ncbi:hypothetical protein [Flavobacterium sp.]|uniref:hypothetical protein n=1 Tax=Flavobacterium sp. TaxID=239 RepID=UPI0039E49496
MKKLFLLLLFGFALGHAQEAAIKNKLLLESDFKTQDGRMLVSEFPCQFSNNKVLISVICKTQAFKEFGIQKINDMILFAHDKIRNTIPVGYGYKPSEIKMSYNPEAKAWSMTSLFASTDAAGMTRENLLALDFDNNGKFLLMKKIF